MNSIVLHDYQEQIRLRIEEVFNASSDAKLNHAVRVQHAASVMVQMPTGTGKTYVLAAVIRDEISRKRSANKQKSQNRKAEESEKQRYYTTDGSEIWVIAHRRELVEQTVKTISRFGLTCASVGFAAKTVSSVRVMSIQWLSRHYDSVTAKPSLIIIDEAHHSLARSYQELWQRFPMARKIGFTATPCRMQRQSFTSLYDILLQSWGIKKFIMKGYLALYDYVVTNRNSEEQIIIDSLERRGTDGDYSVSEMGEKLNVEAAIFRLHQSVTKYVSGKKGIVYAIDRKHARHIAEFYSANGLRAVAVDSLTPSAQRTSCVERFRRGDIDVLVNVGLFDEGFDCPDVEFIQLARPTLSLSKYMQMIGRGLRVHPDKKMCVIIDNVGLCRVFGMPDEERDWHAMFLGEKTGKGSVKTFSRKGISVDNGMEVVTCHSRMQASSDFDTYLEQVEPFEKDGRWGLRVGSDIILRPVYSCITPFVGKYCTFKQFGLWGILLRNGRQYINAGYSKIELLPDGDAIMTRRVANTDRSRRVHLDTTITDDADINEWWGAENAYEMQVRQGLIKGC